MKPEELPFPEKPSLRPGCELSLQSFQAGDAWVLENLASGKFYRMGMREERLLRLLDGKRNLLEILSQAAALPEPFAPEEVLQFLQHLRMAGLLDEETPLPFPKKAPFNPMFVKWRIGNPDPFLTRWETALRKLPQGWLFPCFFVLAGAASYAVASDFSRFAAAVGGVFSPGNLVSLLACFWTLKIVHELAHGLVCKHFGGRVPEVGLLFVFFVPLTYIDATSSWRFPSRSARILVSAAGILAELFVASCAALVWANTDFGKINSLAANVVVAASVTTLLFNANPLMRFDGYFILADALGQPNLYARAARASSAWLAWIFLGLAGRENRSAGFALYGFSCLVWRTLLIFGLCIAAVAYLSGFGMILAALTLASSYFPLLARIPKTVATWKAKGTKVSVGHIGFWLVFLAFSFWVPVVFPPVLPAIIEPAEKVVLRVYCPGFVREVRVFPGQEVREGELLFRLENSEEEMRAKKLESDAARARARALLAGEQNESAKMAQQMRQADALLDQAKEARAYLATLEVRAPCGGKIFGRNFAQMEGLFLPSGFELASLGAESEREVRIALPQREFDSLRPKVGDSVRVFVPGRSHFFAGEVVGVESAATREIRFASMTALGGGELDVIKDFSRVAGGVVQEGGRTPATAGFLLVEPQFYLVAKMGSVDGETLYPGEAALVSFPGAKKKTVWQFVLAWVENFVEVAGRGGEEKLK